MEMKKSKENLGDIEEKEHETFNIKEIKTEIKIENVSMRYPNKNGGEPVTALKDRKSVV